MVMFGICLDNKIHYYQFFINVKLAIQELVFIVARPGYYFSLQCQDKFDDAKREAL